MFEEVLVSVLMTAYNREKYIREAIESVLASTYKNFELIIVDDKSSDKSVSIAKEYQQKDNRITIYINDINLGDYPNRNKAASYATGKYIFYVDSDDTIYKDSIQYCVNNMEQNVHAGMGMIYTAEKIQAPILLTSKESLHNHFFRTPYLGIGPGGTFLKKSFFDSIKGYPTSYGPANDMYFNLKAANNGNILLLPYIFVNYRRHDGQEINNTDSYLVNNYAYMRDALSNLDLKLTDKEIKWLHKKNKRRFVINISKYFLKCYSFIKTIDKIKKADFKLKDAIEGIFHLD
jgi:glycosyltransferase involved in cell wall biosynthesis